MTRLNRACLVTAALWVAMHVWHGLVFLDRYAPAGGLLALVVCVGTTCRAASPLVTANLELRSSEAAVLAALGATSAAIVIPNLDSTDLRSYANWPLGALGPLIAALVMRRRPGWAAALTAASCAITVGAVEHSDLAYSWAVSLCFPPLLWMSASVLVRRIFDWTDAAIGGYDEAERRARQRAEQAAARERVASARRTELRVDVLPLLERIAGGAPLESGLRTASGEVAAQLRDELRARSILTPALKQQLHRARRAGTRVAVFDDRDLPIDDEIARRTRDLIATSLHQLHGAEVMYRISADGTAITLVARGAERILAAASRLQLQPSMTSVLQEDVLFCRCDLSCPSNWV